MKIEGMSGDYAFKAAFWNDFYWHVPNLFFFDIEEVRQFMIKEHNREIVFKYPVTLDEEGILYAPSENELS